MTLWASKMQKATGGENKNQCMKRLKKIIEFSKTSAIKKNIFIILDDNMYNRSMIHDYVKLANFSFK